MKTEKIRALFVENVIADMDIAINELQNDDLKYSWVRVETRDTFLKELQVFKPDVIVCNYSVPGFSGLDGFKTTLKMSSGVPVILLTGTVDEEMAVACIKAGASDIIGKSKISRLPLAVRDALAMVETRRKSLKEEQSHLKQETGFWALIESTSVTAYLKDEEYKYVFVNKAAENFLGKSVPEIQGKTDFDLVKTEMATHIRLTDKRAIENMSPVVTIEHIGSRIFENRKFPVTLQNGKTGVGGFIYEITTPVGHETWTRLQETEIQTVESSIVVADSHGTIQSVNPAFTKLTGYTPEESLGRNMIDLLKTNLHNDEFFINLWGTILRGNVWQGKIINHRKDGNIYIEEMTITPLKDYYGNVSQYVVVKQEVVERKVFLPVTGTFEKDYLQLIDNARIGTYTTTLEGKFTHLNESMCNIIECQDAEKVLNTQIQNVFKHPEQWNNLLSSLLTNDKTQNIEIDLVTVNGKDRFVLMNAILENNQIIGVVLDTTKLRNVESELVKIIIKAEESDKLKTSFLVNMSHDFRTPIAAVQGFAELLASTGPGITEKTEYVEKITSSSRQLLKMIDSYTEITKIVSGQITASPVEFEFNRLLKDIFTEFSPAALQKNLKMNYHLGLADKASYIKFDDQKLRIVLSNLIDNAIKFNDAGSVDFGYELKDSILEMYVKDTGWGISPEYRNEVFDRFRKLEDPYTRKTEGSGLGLSIAKAYVELLGGKIWVDSQTDKGSTFIFSIPYLPVEAPAKIVPEIQKGELNLHNRKILVAEDDETNFEYMKRLLTRADATVLRASNGKEAVERCASENDIEMVLMDINMPTMNGLDATRLIKNVSPNLPIIALTAYALDGNRETCLAAGCDDYMAKPIHRDELFTKLINRIHN